MISSTVTRWHCTQGKNCKSRRPFTAFKKWQVGGRVGAKVSEDQPVTVYGRNGYPKSSRLSEAEKKANEDALDQYRLGWASGNHTIILDITNSPTFNFYWVTDNDPVYADRFPTFFDDFKKAAETASGKPYSMRFPNIIHRGVYWLCARDGQVLWDTATTGRVVGVEHKNKD